MVTSPEQSGEGQHDDRQAFALQLPKRIAAIEDIWARLENGAWDRAQLEALYERVLEISEYSKSHALYQLNESVFSLEVYLSSYVGTDISPDAVQIDAIGGLVRGLKTAADLTLSAQREASFTDAQPRVFMLGEPEGLIADLARELVNKGCQVSSYADSQALLADLPGRPPKVIVADTTMLPRMAKVSAELSRLRSHLAVPLPLIFVSEPSTLQLRVDAIRAGGDGFFVAPLDNAALASRIRDMAMPNQIRANRVVVVEDDPTQADFAASILRKGGMQVLQVTDPVDIIGALRSFKPDLILMDIYMPGVNGIELTTIIRDHREFIAIPIVFLSGEQNTDKQLDALSVGGDDFVAKPIRPKHLLAVVETRIRRARQMMSATGHPPKHDRVTGLLSREHLLDRIERLARDKPGEPGPAVMVMQIDDLARLQQSIGVGGVDHLMSQFGALIAGQIQEQDFAARIDESSFGIVIRGLDAAAVEVQGQRLLSEIRQHGGPNSAGLAATVQIGICFIDGGVADPNGILNRARSACKTTITEGSDHQVHTYSQLNDASESTVEIDESLGNLIRDALLNDSFIIQYQPLLDLQTRGSETYEIVLRLENSQGDLVGDRQLQTTASEMNLGPALDSWILERAIKILKQRRDSGRRTRIFVHQSGHSALDPELPAILLEQLRKRQMVGTGLVIDFKLPELSKDLRTAKHNIGALREMDIEVSLSRFPEKEAAFKVLRFLQAQYINIAPRLLKADRKVISSVIKQAHDLTAKVIVSNVDDPRSIDLHWSSGADFLQGNFIQRPIENMDYDFSQVVI